MNGHGKLLTTCLVFAILCLVGSIGYAYYVRGASAQTACLEVEKLKAIVRADEQQQLKESQDYLDQHPNGAPGIPRELIVRSIARRKQNVANLRPLNCNQKGR